MTERGQPVVRGARRPVVLVRRPFSVSILLLLFVLAVVPLAGAGWFTTQEFNRMRAARSDVAHIAELATRHAEIARLRSLVLDERNWVVVQRGLEELGIPPSLVVQFTGIDTAAELDGAQSAVDAAAAATGLVDVADHLAPLRTGVGSLDETEEGYLALDASLAARGDSVLRDLLIRAGDVDGGGDLIASLRELELGTTARLAVASQVTTYFSVQFPAGGDVEADLRSLVGQQSSYEDAVAELSRSVRSGSASSSALARVEGSDAVLSFRGAIDEAISGAVAGGIPPGEFSSEAVFSDIDRVVAGFTSGIDSAAIHRALVEGAAADVAATSEDAARSAAEAASRAGKMLAVLIVLTIVTVLGVSHLIAAPLRRLATRANQLRLTGDVAFASVGGPSEVRDVGAAIDEASAHIALAERQAHALARGDLADPALTEPAPGQLGASLQRAVRLLATSLDEREEYRAQLVHEAAHDGLTSLANRNAALERLEESLSRMGSGASLAVLFIDLDGFKAVNDSHGHHVGDVVLQIIAQRLTRELRAGDYAGRLGGDEFVVVAEPIDQPADAIEIARRMRRAIAEPIRIRSLVVEIDACVGIAVADADSGATAHELLCDADLAVYKAKSVGRGAVELCDAALKREAEHDVRLKDSLRRAVSESELCLAYQPIIDRRTREPIGLEALVRWDHPERGLVQPGEFVPFAERSDLIIDIDRWVIGAVCEQLGAWKDDTTKRSWTVAVNVSARHFGADRCVANIVEPLRRSGADPSSLVVEVTESALLVDVADAAAKLDSLRSLGISVVLDDFGSGYTSLAYLRKLPIDGIKIDGSFIADPGALPFVKLIIDVGHLIGAIVTAEGVESDEQVEVLSHLGCDRFQGFLFGRPQAAPVTQLGPRLLVGPAMNG